MVQSSLQNAAGDGDPLFRCFGDAVFIQRQTHHGRAVLLHNRQHTLQNLRLSVDRVHRSLAVIDPQPCLQCVRVGGIELQRHSDRALQLLYHSGQHNHFIHTGEAYVHIQDVRSGILLLDTHIQDIVQVIFQQCLLETLFPGGVDTLANHPHTIQSDGCHRGTDKTGVVIVPGYGLFSFQNCRQPTNVFRGCTATAAHDGDTSLHAGQQSLGKVLRSHIIVSIHRVRQARVRLGNDRQAGILTQFFQQRRQQVWPQRTVQSNSVRTQALQCTGHGGDRTAGESPAAGIKGHGDKHRQVGGLLGRQQGSLGLVQVCHGFHHD